MKVFFSIALLCIAQMSSHAQMSKSTQKGKLFMYWGWNGAHFTKSNVHLTGNDYNFTIHKMTAKDRQSPFSMEYFKPATFTIPQYNYRIGYFVKDNWSVSIGMDHMKYVMVQNQFANLSGNIHNKNSVYQGTLDGSYPLTEAFFTFEHTDGLNNLNIETRYHKVLKHFPLDKKKNGISIEAFAGAGGGALIPKTNAQLFRQERYDAFHISGFDLHAVAGVQFNIWKHFFIASEAKAGYINMPNIRITHSSSDKAAQAFGYVQYNILFGASINVKK